MKNAAPLAMMILAALSLAACGEGPANPSASPSEKKSGPVVATIGKTAITLNELDAKLEMQPVTRSRLNTLERKREFLDNLVRFELLAEEARRRGMDKDPDVLEAMKRVMVQKLTQDQFGEDTTDETVTEAEARAFYDENLHDYVKPERVRLSHVFFSAPIGDALRNKVRGEAQRSLAEVMKKEAEKDRGAFAQLAKTRSDDETSKRAGGDLSFRTLEELTEMWGEAMAKAAFALHAAGDFGSLIETEKGYHLIKLTGRQPVLDRPFETMKAQIENRLSREKKTKAFEAFVADLEANTKVVVNDEILDRLEGGGPMPAQGMPMGVPGGPRPVPVNPSGGPIPAKAPGN